MKNPKHIKKQGLKKKGRKAGLPPGSMIRQVGKFSEHVELTCFLFNESELEEKTLTDIKEISSLKRKGKVLWLNVSGLNNIDILKDLGEMFELHPLMMEDILNTDQRPKTDDFGNRLSISLRMLYFHKHTHDIEDEQITLVLGEDFVISFQEKPGDVFNPVRERLRKSGGKIRTSGADYMLYALTDLIVDHYFILIEAIGEKVENLEDEVFMNAGQSQNAAIHFLKREMIIFRRGIFPLREALSQVQRTSSDLIKSDTLRFFNDVYDHVIHVLDLVENYRELNSGLKDIYISMVSFQMNKVMQLLTIISTIFIPLTFIVGVYGMNFQHMPELYWKYGYFFIWGIMLLVFVSMLFFFRRKKWL